jgi:hypothetical protein
MKFEVNTFRSLAISLQCAHHFFEFKLFIFQNYVLKVVDKVCTYGTNQKFLFVLRGLHIGF